MLGILRIANTKVNWAKSRSMTCAPSRPEPNIQVSTNQMPPFDQSENDPPNLNLWTRGTGDSRHSKVSLQGPRLARTEIPLHFS